MDLVPYVIAIAWMIATAWCCYRMGVAAGREQEARQNTIKFKDGDDVHITVSPKVIAKALNELGLVAMPKGADFSHKAEKKEA